MSPRLDPAALSLHLVTDTALSASRATARGNLIAVLLLQLLAAYSLWPIYKTERFAVLVLVTVFAGTVVAGLGGRLALEPVEDAVEAVDVVVVVGDQQVAAHRTGQHDQRQRRRQPRQDAHDPAASPSSCGQHRLRGRVSEGCRLT